MAAVPFSLRIDTELKEQLEAEARLEDRSAAYILQQAAREYIDRKSQFRDMVRGLEQEADKGVFISSAAVRKWIVSRGTNEPLPFPESDIFPENS